MERVIVIGGGIAGMKTALDLNRRGVGVTILEKENRLGGKVLGWHKLFPTFTPAGEVVDTLKAEIAAKKYDCNKRKEPAKKYQASGVCAPKA